MLWTVVTYAAQVQVCGPHMTVQAADEPLEDVMQQLTELGISVSLDPALRSMNITRGGSGSVEEVISAMVAPYGYTLVWATEQGGFGAVPVLEEVRIFRVGHEQESVELPVQRVLDVRTGWTGGEYVANEILIRFNPGTSYEAFELLLRQLGASVVESWPELGIYRLRFPDGTNIEAMLEQLKRQEMVNRCEPNYVYRMPEGEVQPSSFFVGEGVPMRKIPTAEGPGTVAILDSGLMAMDGLSQAVVGSYDAFSDDGTISDPAGHGTQMALVAAGAVIPDGGIAVQSAAGLPLLAIRAFDKNGATSSMEIMRSLDYAIKNGARVINLSWGSENESEFLQYAMRYAQSKNVLVVAAVGNEPINRPVYPAAYPEVLAVSAVDGSGTAWSQSNYGSFVDVAAPGGAQFSVGYNGPPGGYMGTSVASVYVAKMLGEYAQRHPGATAQDMLNALAAAVEDAGNEGRDDVYGVGVLSESAVRKLLDL